MVGAEQDAWGLWASAEHEAECELWPWLGVDAGEPSSPSWDCMEGCRADRVTCEAPGACGDGATVGWRRGCAHWGQQSHGRASGYCG